MSSKIPIILILGNYFYYKLVKPYTGKVLNPEGAKTSVVYKNVNLFDRFVFMRASLNRNNKTMHLAP